MLDVGWKRIFLHPEHVFSKILLDDWDAFAISFSAIKEVLAHGCLVHVTVWEVSKCGVISGSYFPVSDWIRRDTEYLSVFSPNAGKYGPEITPYLDTFHTVRNHQNHHNHLLLGYVVINSYWFYLLPAITGGGVVKCVRKYVRGISQNLQSLNPY